MRSAVLLATLFTLPACDGGGPDDALVGTWRLDALTETIRVTSQTAQALPDLGATPTASVAVTGAVSADLDVVTSLSGPAVGFIELAVATDARDAGVDATELVVTQWAPNTQASLSVPGSSTGFSEFYGDATIVERDGGRFTIRPLTLRGAGTGEVVVGGTVVYPEIALAAGEPTEVQPYEEDLDGVLTVTFDADGTFSAQATGPGGAASATGTWDRLGADRIRLTTTDGDAIESGEFEVSVDGGTLVLKGADLGREIPCDAECVAQIEAVVFAEPGSLSAVAEVTTFRFRASG